MKVGISINHAAHQREHGEAAAEGFKKHGISFLFLRSDEIWPEADFHITWSVKRPNIFQWSKDNNKHILVMERGYVGNRMKYTSCGWDGLAGRGKYPEAKDSGARWKEKWSHLMQPWQYKNKGYALLIGQVAGDASLYPMLSSFYDWAQDCAATLKSIGYSVVFRPHPFSVKNGHDYKAPPGAKIDLNRDIQESLSGASLCVTFSSTAGVDAVLAGVPTIALDVGSMAWRVASHNIRQIKTVDREEWAHDLAWTQWSLDEIASGEMLEHLKGVIKNGTTTETFSNRQECAA